MGEAKQTWSVCTLHALSLRAYASPCTYPRIFLQFNLCGECSSLENSTASLCHPLNPHHQCAPVTGMAVLRSPFRSSLVPVPTRILLHLSGRCTVGLGGTVSGNAA